MVTDEELDRAAEQAETAAPEESDSENEQEQQEGQEQETAQEEGQEQEQEEEQESAVEPSDHGERSKLGRKVKKIEDMMTKMSGQLEYLNTQKKETKEDAFDPDDSAPMTKGELASFMEEYITKKDSEKQKADREYESKYLQQVASLGLDFEESDYNEITKELYDNYNVKRTGNPEMDAELNFEKAQNSVLKKKVKQPKNPLKKGGDKKPLGGPSNTSVADKPAPSVKLDEHAEEFIKKTGMDVEEAQKILQGDAPAYLKR